MRSQFIDICARSTKAAFLSGAGKSAVRGVFVALTLACTFSPQLSFAQEVATISASPAGVMVGESIQVTYSLATTRIFDSIIMVDVATKQIVSRETTGSMHSGTKTFIARNAGVFEFQYQASMENSPILAVSSQVIVIPQGGATPPPPPPSPPPPAPSPSPTPPPPSPSPTPPSPPPSPAPTPPPAPAPSPTATISASPASVLVGESIQVTYSLATTRIFDSIIMVDTTTKQVLARETTGSTHSGIKTFIARTPGTFEFQYQASVGGSPILAVSSPVTVKLPGAELYSLTPSVTTLASGEPLIVSYAAPGFAYQPSDSIVILNASNAVVSSQSVGAASLGTKTFILRNPGTYSIQYRLAVSGSPIVKTAGPVTVTLPNESLFILTPNVTVAEINQPITVVYAAPAFAHQFTDLIAVYESTTGRLVDASFVGSSPQGLKTFKIADPGTYTFTYKMSITGVPVVKQSAPLPVVYVDLTRIRNYPLRAGPIVALGDSITFGRDASHGNDYVSLLSARFGEPILNAGVSGDTTAEALLRLDNDVLSKDPRLVLVFLGGNDVLQKETTDTIFTNLATIVSRIEANGSAVLILSYRDFSFVDYDPRYRAIAAQNGAAYTPDLMKGILGNPFLTSDLIHPRDNGHKIIADRVEPYLHTLLGK